MKKSFGIRVGRVILAILRPIVFCIFPYRFVHRERIPKTEGSLVICCNHISMIDPVFLFLACRHPIYFMAKEELFQNRFFAWFLKTCFGVFPVARGRGDSSAITNSLSVLENGHILGIFPEGTRSKDGTLGPAKSGASLIASKAQASILPCAVMTPNGQVKLFQKTTVVFGDILTPKDLHLDGEKPDLRFASRKLMAVIGDLIEENAI